MRTVSGNTYSQLSSRLGAVNQATQNYTHHYTGYNSGNVVPVIGRHSPVYPIPTWGTPRRYGISPLRTGPHPGAVPTIKHL